MEPKSLDTYGFNTGRHGGTGDEVIADIFRHSKDISHLLQDPNGPSTHPTAHIQCSEMPNMDLNPWTHPSTLPDMARRDGAIGAQQTLDTPYSTQCSQKSDMAMGHGAIGP